MNMRAATMRWSGMTRCAVALAGVLPLIQACQRTDSVEAGQFLELELPSGAILTRSPSQGAWLQGEVWSLQEDLRLGRTDGEGPDVFGEITAIEVDALGRIYVLDTQASDVRVFSPTGQHVRTFGRRGSGPGELARPVALTWGHEATLWVLNNSDPRWEVFDTLGAYVDRRHRVSNYMMMPWPGRFDQEGRMIEVVGPGRVARHDATGSKADTFDLALAQSEVFELTTGGSRTTANVPFAPHPRWHLDSDGFVWYGTGASYTVARRHLSGDTVRVVEREFSPSPVSDADRTRAVAQLQWAVERGMQIDESRIPGVKPAYQGFFTDDRAFLWVATTYAFEGDFAMYEDFDVFDNRGRYLGEVRSPVRLLPFVAPVVRGDYLYGVAIDALRVMSVVRLRIVGRS